MRILITGGAGFIGSHLCHYFVQKGCDVICMDNLLTGRAANIAALMGNPRFAFQQYDVTNFIHIDGPLDYILHFASPASPANFEQLGIRILKVGALGTHKALGLACAKHSKFFLASTSEIYGDPQVHPQSEEYRGNVNTIGIRGVYDEAKRFAESMAMAYHRLHGVDTRIVRIFNTYGERMRRDDGRAIPNFITQALAGDDLTVYGEGNQTRSLCYVSDLVDGIDRLMQAPINTPVNLGNPVEFTILQLAETILEYVGSRSKIVFHPLPQDDPKVRLPDISKAREQLGWEPQVSPETGLKQTIEWFRTETSREKDAGREHYAGRESAAGR